MMRYTVIGLGQFGQELCTELSARNIEVVAVASTDEELEQIKDLVTYAVVTDYTNPAALRELELDDQSAVIVAIGDSFEENLLVVTHLQKMGVRYIYARVMSPVHEHILSQMNVYALINLSRVASKQLASQLESPEFLRVSPMDENHSIVEIAVPRIWVPAGCGPAHGTPPQPAHHPPRGGPDSAGAPGNPVHTAHSRHWHSFTGSRF